jgi:hypothetical protein
MMSPAAGWLTRAWLLCSADGPCGRPSDYRTRRFAWTNRTKSNGVEVGDYAHLGIRRNLNGFMLDSLGQSGAITGRHLRLG